MTLFAVALSAEIRGGKDCLSIQFFHSETEVEAKQRMRKFVFRDLYHQGVEAENIHVKHIESVFITAGDLVG